MEYGRCGVLAGIVVVVVLLCVFTYISNIRGRFAPPRRPTAPKSWETSMATRSSHQEAEPNEVKVRAGL